MTTRKKPRAAGKPSGRVAQESRDKAQPITSSLGATVARLRGEQSLSAYALGQRLAIAHGGSSNAWRVAIERIEQPAKGRNPRPETVGIILRELGADLPTAATAEVLQLVDAAEIARLVTTYGEHAETALRAAAGVARMTLGLVRMRGR